MAVLLDTGVLYSYYDRRDAWHEPTLELFRQEQAGLIVPSPVIAEADYILGQRVGQAAQWALYEGLAEQYYYVADLSSAGYKRVLELNQQYAALRLGFTDAAVIAIAEELGVARIATTDRRHFSAVTARMPLVLLP